MDGRISRRTRGLSGLLPLLDVLAFSSVWVAAAAGALAAVAARAMGGAPPPAVVGLAFFGTLVVYNVDRLRDVDRDRATTPLRSDFVARRGGELALLVASAALAAAGFAAAGGRRVLWVLLPVALLGFLHRRLKAVPWAKSAYLTGAWLAVAVGLPALLVPAPRHVAGVALVLGAALLANAVASSVRDREAAAKRLGARNALRVARAAAAAGAVAALLAPPAVRALAPVPLATLVALLLFRPSERYGLLVIDGALLAGTFFTSLLLYF